MNVFEQAGIQWPTKVDEVILCELLEKDYIELLKKEGTNIRPEIKAEIAYPLKEYFFERYMKIENLELFKQYWKIEDTVIFPEKALEFIKLEYLPYTRKILFHIRDGRNRVDFVNLTIPDDQKPKWRRMLKEIMPEFHLRKAFTAPDRLNAELNDRIEHRMFLWKEEIIRKNSSDFFEDALVDIAIKMLQQDEEKFKTPDSI